MDEFSALADHPACVALAEAFTDAGRSLYLVGGCVRDACLAKNADLDFSDLDFTTDAPVDQVAELLTRASAATQGGRAQLWTVGMQHGTVAALVAGEKVEVTTHRSDQYDNSDSRQPTVSFTTNVVDDLARRDLTINAVALQLTPIRAGRPNRQLIDPFGGLDDLDAAVLRTPCDANKIICEDPLRSIRALRFMVRFDATLAGELSAAIAANADRLTILSAERIADELSKIIRLGGKKTAEALAAAAALGVDRHLLGGIEVTRDMLSLVASTEDPDDILAAILLSVMTRSERSETNAHLEPLGLQGRGELAATINAAASGQAGAACRQLKLANAQSKHAIAAAATVLHMSHDGHSAIEPARLVRETSSDVLAAALRLSDASGRGGGIVAQVKAAAHNSALLRAPLPVNGKDLLAQGHKGPAVARALDTVLAAFLTDPTLGREEALSATS